MAVKIPLKMSDGTPVRTMEELREHFDFPAVLKHYSSGNLGRWLSDRYYDEEAEKVKALNPSSKNFKKNLCAILGVDYLKDKADKVDLSDIARKNERRERLKQYTADDSILAWVDNVAFSQEELTKLLERLDSLKTDENDNKVIYLCGEHFTIPGNIGGIIYKGVNSPMVKFDHKDIEAGIDFQDLDFNIEYYICEDDYSAFYDVFWENNLLLGIKLLRMAAKKGSAKAQFQLGVCYENGKGVEQDVVKALEWYRKAAEQGNSWAHFQIASCYENGKGVEQDMVKASEWSDKGDELFNAEFDLWMKKRGIKL